MCLAALAINADRRFPLVLAANRDEYFDRPAAPLHWWAFEPGGPEILAGRDLFAGGTWMGLSRAGRLAFVTNVRNPTDRNPDAPSRGSLVPLWLRGDLSMEAFSAATSAVAYNGFNLIAVDVARDESFWTSNRAGAPQKLEPGVHAVSNALLDTPWPKVQQLKQRTQAAVQTAASAEALAEALLAALADPTQAPDELLPDTGVPIELERLLSPAFIRSPDGRYGTRCSTVIITERLAHGSVTHVIERSWEPAAGAAQAVRTNRMTLIDWPAAARPALPAREATDPVRAS